MVIVLLIICLPVSTAITGYIAFKGVQLGLRWQIQAEAKQAPEMKNPISQAVAEAKERRIIEEQQSICDEWLNGARK